MLGADISEQVEQEGESPSATGSGLFVALASSCSRLWGEGGLPGSLMKSSMPLGKSSNTSTLWIIRMFKLWRTMEPWSRTCRELKCQDSLWGYTVSFFIWFHLLSHPNASLSAIHGIELTVCQESEHGSVMDDFLGLRNILHLEIVWMCSWWSPAIIIT